MKAACSARILVMTLEDTEDMVCPNEANKDEQSA